MWALQSCTGVEWGWQWKSAVRSATKSGCEKQSAVCSVLHTVCTLKCAVLTIVRSLDDTGSSRSRVGAAEHIVGVRLTLAVNPWDSLLWYFHKLNPIPVPYKVEVMMMMTTKIMTMMIYMRQIRAKDDMIFQDKKLPNLLKCGGAGGRWNGFYHFIHFLGGLGSFLKVMMNVTRSSCGWKVLRRGGGIALGWDIKQGGTKHFLSGHSDNFENFEFLEYFEALPENV